MLNKKNILKVSLVTLLVIGFSGCAVKTGNEKLADTSKAELNQSIVKGKTTKEEVRTLMGDPGDIDFDQNGHEKWTYVNVRRAVKGVNYIPVANWFVRGTNDTTKKLVILFDENGKVFNYITSTAHGETKAGLFQ